MRRENVAKKNRIYLGAMIILIGIICFCFSATAYSRNNASGEELRRYYAALEKELQQNVKTYLNENGFRNSGVTITCVMEEMDQREYTVTIHHDRIDRMEERDRQELSMDLSRYGFDYNHCSFFYEFLITN